MKIKKNVIVW